MSNVAYDMYADRIARASTVKHFGKVTQVVGLVIESAGPAVSIGRLCHYRESRERRHRSKPKWSAFATIGFC